mgnify:CR=1 FL=1
MTAIDTNTDETDKIIDRRADDYGSRRSRLPGVDAATMSVEVPEHYAAEKVSVSGYAYDDQPGEVELSIGGGVQVGVWIDSDGARELAEQLRIAADEADAEIGGET